MNNTITIIIIYFSLSLVSLFVLQFFLSKKRKQNQKQFVKYWALIKKSIQNNNNSDVCNLVVLMFNNPYFLKQHYDQILSYLEILNDSKSIAVKKSISEIYKQKGWTAI